MHPRPVRLQHRDSATTNDSSGIVTRTYFCPVFAGRSPARSVASSISYGEEDAAPPPGRATYPSSAGFSARHNHPRAAARLSTPLLRATSPPSRLLLPVPRADVGRDFSPPAFAVGSSALCHGQRC